MMILLIDYKMQLISIVIIKFIEFTTFGKCVTSIKRFTLRAGGKSYFPPAQIIYSRCRRV